MAVKLQELGRAVKRLQHQHHRTVDARLAEIGTTLAQWDALRAIAQRPGASSHALAQRTFQTDQSFGALATRLLARGHVDRLPGKGRVIAYALTPAGADLLARGTVIAEEVLRASFAPLDEGERAMMLDLLVRLLPEEP